MELAVVRVKSLVGYERLFLRESFAATFAIVRVSVQFFVFCYVAFVHDDFAAMRAGVWTFVSVSTLVFSEIDFLRE